MNPLAVCQVQAGFPSPADDFIQRPLSLDEYLIDNPPATFFVEVVGQSMIKMGVFEGDIAVVNRAKKPKHGNIVVAIKDNAFLIKELLIERNQLKLRAHSNDFPTQHLDESNGDYVWGVVCGIVRKL